MEDTPINRLLGIIALLIGSIVAGKTLVLPALSALAVDWLSVLIAAAALVAATTGFIGYGGAVLARAYISSIAEAIVAPGPQKSGQDS